MTSSSYDLDTALCDEMQQYQTRDVIGCGIDFKEKKIFYTKNGKLLSIFAFHCYLDSMLTINLSRQ